jgi:hypothetical protein
VPDINTRGIANYQAYCGYLCSSIPSTPVTRGIPGKLTCAVARGISVGFTRCSSYSVTLDPDLSPRYRSDMIGSTDGNAWDAVR